MELPKQCFSSYIFIVFKTKYNTNTGQYTHFSSFEPFARDTAWAKDLFLRAFIICSNNELFENQIFTIKSFMSWNGFPNNIKNLIINKLRKRQTSSTPPNAMPDNDRPKIWFRISYHRRRGEHLVKAYIKEIRHLKEPINFIVIYNTKKISYFLSNKDKIPDLSRTNVFYQVFCPGCSHK